MVETSDGIGRTNQADSPSTPRKRDLVAVSSGRDAESKRGKKGPVPFFVLRSCWASSSILWDNFVLGC